MSAKSQIIQLFVVSLIAIISTTLFFRGLIGIHLYTLVIGVYLLNCFALSIYDRINTRKD